MRTACLPLLAVVAVLLLRMLSPREMSDLYALPARLTNDERRTPASGKIQPPSVRIHAPHRDYRIDVLRGAALLIILWTHMGWSMSQADTGLFRLRPGAWGLSDVADMFIFLSGYVYALAYRRVYEAGGLGAMLRKSLLRAWELYAMNMLVFALVVALCALFRLLVAPSATAAIPMLALLFEQPLHTLSRALLLSYDIPYFDILVLYIELLLLAPVLYTIARWRWWAAHGISLALYVLAQVGVNFRDSYFNPLAWQFLFTIAMSITLLPHVPRRRSWMLIALAFAIGVLVLMRIAMPLAELGLLPSFDWLVLQDYGEKRTLGPLRLLQFMGFAYGVHYFTRSQGSVWTTRYFAPIRLLSKHALGVFGFGIFCTYLGVLTSYAISAGAVGNVLIGLIAILASIAMAYLLERKAQAQPLAHRCSAVGG